MTQLLIYIIYVYCRKI